MGSDPPVTHSPALCVSALLFQTSAGSLALTVLRFGVHADFRVFLSCCAFWDGGVIHTASGRPLGFPVPKGKKKKTSRELQWGETSTDNLKGKLEPRCLSCSPFESL